MTRFPNGLETNGRANIGNVEFTVGAESTNSIKVTVQVKDGAGDDVAAPTALWFYLSDDSGGAGVTATAPDGDIAVGTDGAILAEATADKVFLILSEADGDIDLDIGEAAGGTWYLVAVLPDGHISVSDAITFAA
ncbi:hypothetical protein G4Y79_15275 [Phototrophicus methaneseepsis]|uniref:Uncharacterized protein n=1 Tax=Phototrophicus methaneseepsis TaxID=2710758 RepID=A0A7S8E6A8_9CHLR|nr:hypothetical protein [Phototrophicus methaneseepsis]QPC81064.1 hypothetical protein G4Y79_15275 [Phototrophicus methaneseepsis]